jgi:hypothetical protein
MRGGFRIRSPIEFLADINSLTGWAHEVIDNSEDIH